MVRPRNIRKTVQKTYSFYEDSIDEILKVDGCAIGKNPKDIFDLGILAIKHGWSPHKDSNRVEDLKNRIKSMALTLNLYTSKFDRLVNIVEKGLDLRIDSDLKNLHEVEKKLDEVL